jgi:hypothetical protein
MDKNPNIRTLFHILNGCLPYEFDTKLITNENTIIITKEDSDNAMYITLNNNDNNDHPATPDDPDDVIAIGHDDPNRGYYVEYEPISRSSENEQIPLDTIIDNIRHNL